MFLYLRHKNVKVAITFKIDYNGSYKKNLGCYKTVLYFEYHKIPISGV